MEMERSISWNRPHHCRGKSSSKSVFVVASKARFPCCFDFRCLPSGLLLCLNLPVWDGFSPFILKSTFHTQSMQPVEGKQFWIWMPSYLLLTLSHPLTFYLAGKASSFLLALCYPILAPLLVSYPCGVMCPLMCPRWISIVTPIHSNWDP